MSKIRIKNDSGDREFFTIIPNYILNHSTHTDQALYLQMKRFAGEDGKCFATQETLMNKLGIGRQAYNKSLEYLIRRGWIEYTGLTGGRTRPIKTYKINNIWQQNSDFYKKIPSETAVSKNTVSNEKDTVQNSSKIPSETDSIRRTIIKKNQEEEIAKRGFAEVVAIIDAFKEINPSYKDWYKNKTQRIACQWLLDTYGIDDTLRKVGALMKINSMPYAPTTTTPHELKNNLPKLKAFAEKQKVNKFSTKLI